MKESLKELQRCGCRRRHRRRHAFTIFLLKYGWKKLSQVKYGRGKITENRRKSTNTEKANEKPVIDFQALMNSHWTWQMNEKKKTPISFWFLIFTLFRSPFFKWIKFLSWKCHVSSFSIYSFIYFFFIFKKIYRGEIFFIYFKFNVFVVHFLFY